MCMGCLLQEQRFCFADNEDNRNNGTIELCLQWRNDPEHGNYCPVGKPQAVSKSECIFYHWRL